MAGEALEKFIYVFLPVFYLPLTSFEQVVDCFLTLVEL